MGLERAYIQPLDKWEKNKGSKIKVLFNPTEYTVEKSNQFQNTVFPGLSTPLTHFINGNAKTLTMELFFDTYEEEENKDVRLHTEKIMNLLDINSELHAPPVCCFVWGALKFKAVIERVTQRFTMFMETGIPVRATLNVTFKEYKTLTEQFQNKPRNSSDRTKQRVLIEGDTLWSLADREYGDPGLWRHIAKANNIDNPRKLKEGREIIVPPLD